MYVYSNRERPMFCANLMIVAIERDFPEICPGSIEIKATVVMRRRELMSRPSNPAAGFWLLPNSHPDMQDLGNVHVHTCQRNCECQQRHHARTYKAYLAPAMVNSTHRIQRIARATRTARNSQSPSSALMYQAFSI
jgi:hypothetical protein